MQKKMITPVLIIMVMFSLVGAFGFWMYRWQYGKADRLLENWARQNSLIVLSKEKANPSGTGPGVRYSGNTQVIYRVEVQDREGKKKTGLVKIGNPSVGVISDEVQVEWDK